MNSPVKFLICAGCGLWFGLAPVWAELTRVPNTTLQMPLNPPVFGYTLTNAFGNVTFTNPVAIRTPPGETNRVFVVEQGGRIAVITNLASPNRSLFLDLTSRILGGTPSDERGLLGLAFHPGYATNGYFFVFYTGSATTAAGTGLHDIVSRFSVSASDPNAGDASSETRLVIQFDQANNHNGGDLNFGPDGYLYVATGDEGGANDQYNNSQVINKDFFSAILRLDVDKRPGNLSPNLHPSSTTNYLVPSDNPFVGATTFNGLPVNPTSVRTEFWAVGLRNPWRFSFDPLTGELYCADVGQNTYEEIDVITRGGNYGWAYREGFHSGAKTAPTGFISNDPILEYTHGSGLNQGFSVTGGVVYRGARFSQLYGAYVFADYVSGNIWITRYSGGTASPMERIAGETGIAGFGVDPSNGDVLMANQGLDRIRRLVYSGTATGAPIPPTLAQTGAFSDTASLTPAPGVVPYDLNVPFWSDNAIKSRWFSIPNVSQKITFSRDGNWLFPTGTVWVKHFELELTNGVPSSRKRLETRLLIKNLTGTFGVTYRWGQSLTDASLVPEAGLDETFVLDQGGGILRTQTWHYPSRQECTVCHTAGGGFGLGFNTAQLNRKFDYGDGPTNQIAALSAATYFVNTVTGVHTLPALAPAANASASLEYRVRSYLSANCANCHQPGGVPQSNWDARMQTPTALAGIVNGTLVNDLGNPNNRVVKPGSLTESVLLSRISTLGPGRMPPLASSVLDTEAIQLLSAWITNDLPQFQTFADWQLAKFGSTNAPNALAEADPDEDRASNYLEFLTRTEPLQSSSVWTISLQVTNGAARISFPQAHNRGYEVQSVGKLDPDTTWQALDVPENAPFYSSSNRVWTVPDILTSTNQFYRVRPFEL